MRWDGGAPDGLRPRAGEDALVWLGGVENAVRAVNALAPTADDRRDAASWAAPLREGFLFRRRLMRACVARWLGVPGSAVTVAYDTHRRPRLLAPDPGLFLSGASREGCHAIALAARPVGVDVERDRGVGEPAWAVLADGERRCLERLPAGERHGAFLLLWTAKEATLKALGTGLFRAPETIAIDPGGPAGRLTIRQDGLPLPVRVAESRSVDLPGGPVRAACVALG